MPPATSRRWRPDPWEGEMTQQKTILVTAHADIATCKEAQW